MATLSYTWHVTVKNYLETFIPNDMVGYRLGSFEQIEGWLNHWIERKVYFLEMVFEKIIIITKNTDRNNIYTQLMSKSCRNFGKVIVEAASKKDLAINM